MGEGSIWFTLQQRVHHRWSLQWKIHFEFFIPDILFPTLLLHTQCSYPFYIYNIFPHIKKKMKMKIHRMKVVSREIKSGTIVAKYALMS